MEMEIVSILLRSPELEPNNPIQLSYPEHPFWIGGDHSSLQGTQICWSYFYDRFSQSVNKCCILTLERAVNQRFSAQEAPVKIRGSSHMVELKYMGVIKWYIRMPTWDKSSASLGYESVTGAPVSDWTPRWRSNPQWASSWVNPDREAVLKISQCGMVKRRRSYGSIWPSPFICLRPSVSHAPREDLVPFGWLVGYFGFMAYQPL